MCLRQKGQGGGREENKRAAQKKIKIPGCTSLPRKPFLFSNKAMKDERDKYFPIGEKLVEEGAVRFHTQEVWRGRGANPHLPQNSWPDRVIADAPHSIALPGNVPCKCFPEPEGIKLIEFYGCLTGEEADPDLRAAGQICEHLQGEHK